MIEDNHSLAKLPAFEPRDNLYLLKLDFDIDAQLRAIHTLLAQHRTANKDLNSDISKTEEIAHKTKGNQNHYATEEWADLLYHSVYQDAAHSMAAVGMLAPLFETIFHQIFQKIGSKFFSESALPTTHPRWNTANSMQWNCHYVFEGGNSRKDIVKGILQLNEALKINDKMPADLMTVLNALFGYRNKMFHHGFEWPADERNRFDQRITEWPDGWFKKSTIDGEPLIFYLSDDFIKKCLETMDQVMNTFGAFVKKCSSGTKP